MTVRSMLDILAMLGCSVYGNIPLFWLVVHPFIDRWRKRGRRAYALILPVWGFLIVITFLIVWPHRFEHLYTNRFAWVPAVTLFYIGFSVYSEAFQNFDRAQVSGLAELEPSRHRQELVTTGIRSRVRHPIYLGHLCEILGWCLGAGLLALYGLAAFAIVTGWVMIRIEDRELEARFGESYRQYRQCVPAVIPRFNR